MFVLSDYRVHFTLKCHIPLAKWSVGVGTRNADDAILVAQSEQGPQRTLDSLTEYCYQWKLAVKKQQQQQQNSF